MPAGILSNNGWRAVGCRSGCNDNQQDDEGDEQDAKDEAPIAQARALMPLGLDQLPPSILCPACHAGDVGLYVIDLVSLILHQDR